MTSNALSPEGGGALYLNASAEYPESLRDITKLLLDCHTCKSPIESCSKSLLECAHLYRCPTIPHMYGKEGSGRAKGSILNVYLRGSTGAGGR